MLLSAGILNVHMTAMSTTNGDQALSTCALECFVWSTICKFSSCGNRQIDFGFQTLRKPTRQTIETNEERAAGNSAPM